MSSSSHQFDQFGPNSGYILDLFRLYETDRNLVGETWASFFDQIRSALGKTEQANYTTSTQYVPVEEAPVNGKHSEPAALKQLPQPELLEGTERLPTKYTQSAQDLDGLQERIYRLVSAFRSRGHFHAQVNPLTKGVMPLPYVEDVDVKFYNFTEQQLAGEYPCAGFRGEESMPLGVLVEQLQRAYCSYIGFEFMHLISQEERIWLQHKVEKRFQSGSYQLTNDQKIRKLQKLMDAEAFEAALHKKYVGHKRFSLQGAETIIPMLNTILEDGFELGVKELVLGMAHRGRLNILRNFLGKPLEEIFSEFEDQNIFSALGSGDVKYHMGFSSTYFGPNGQKVGLTLVPNPSHLEFVCPVVQGVTRAKQEQHYTGSRSAVKAVLIHGDAAFIGQGVVAETLNLAGVEGYSCGGTIHLVINNQIGFTTEPHEARSSVYCTDFAKMIQAPIFHINCEKVESACWAASIALQFCVRYQRDVVLDLYCYRKYGHNEGDDPSFTQPVVYSEIANKPPVSELYGAKLINEGVITREQIDAYITKYQSDFDQGQQRLPKATMGEACPMHGRLRVPSPPTAVPKERLQQIAQTLVTYPEGFVPHPKLLKILEKRVDTATVGEGIDWGFAEALAFGSLVLDGVNVRLSGQDCGRGTFSQRHLVLSHYETGERYVPFTQLQGKASFEVLNSTLSEAAVVGFEFGYASELKNALVMWEAQFGDFANGAQVIIDQFIAASEQKWDQLSGIVLLLPHGFEGQGPEHSSARLERFLQLCADGNMIVCYPSNAGQYFHLLRRQGLNDIKRPLVVMTPKSLLRHAGAACSLSNLTDGQFNTVLENTYTKDDRVEHVIFTTGKIFYDLDTALQAHSNPRTKVIRIEQLYPFPQFEVKRALKEINAKTYVWMQEEPLNMGSWFYMEPYLRRKCDIFVQYCGRPLSASTATGSASRHAVEQKQIIKDFFAVSGLDKL